MSPRALRGTGAPISLGFEKGEAKSTVFNVELRFSSPLIDMADNRSISSADYKDPVVEDAQVEVKGKLKEFIQLSSSGRAAKEKREAEAIAALDRAVERQLDKQQQQQQKIDKDYDGKGKGSSV
uniref:Uncharacterized protein n=1 Tax=Coccidioides posadasii RMSCC 3488 TaxID=454284 RepID=A0A0J6F0I3_COCPO|nr:hypothetical protein CPAG_02725 [Coccidioides posadasii RMSCC 3488]